MFCSLKMKSKIFLNNFLIIMCVTMSFITCRPSSSSDEETEDILGKCLEEMGCKLDTNHNLNSSMVEKLRWKLDAKMRRVEKKLRAKMRRVEKIAANFKEQYLNERAKMLNVTNQMLNVTNQLQNQMLNVTNQLQNEVTEHKRKSDLLQEERNLQIFYQSFFSMYGLIDGLFAESWPQWAPNKPKNRYTAEQWKILLSNVEDSLILAIRTNLEKENIPVQDFIREAQKVCMLCNMFIHEKQLTEKERQEAIEIWRKTYQFHPLENSNTMIILLRRPELSPLTEFQDTVTKQVNEECAAYIVMKIPNFYGMEENLEWNLLKLYENHSGKETKFNGLVVADNSAYVTFENFQSARYLWKKWVNNKNTPTEQIDAVILSRRIPLMKGKGKSNHMFVKLEIIKNNDLIQFERDIFKKIQGEEIRPESRETLSQKDKKKQSSGIEIFYRFQTAYPAIRFYSLCVRVYLLIYVLHRNFFLE